MNFFEYWKTLFKKKTPVTELEQIKADISESMTPEVKAPRLPDGVTFDRIEYDAPTDEQLAAAAEAELDSYKNDSIAAIEREAAAEKSKLEADKAVGGQKLEAEKREIASAYDAAGQKVSDDALKRGVARSSIAVNRMADLEAARAAAVTAAVKSANDKLAALDAELSSLDFKREQALNGFNIALAAKLTERINELKAERNDRQTEVVKYNNSLTEKEQKYAADKAVQDDKLYESSLKRQELEDEYAKRYGRDDATQKAAYEKLRAALSAMDKADAKAALRDDPFFEDTLTSYYYYKLYDEFGR